MIYPALSSKEAFLNLVTDKLGTSPVDFSEDIRTIKETRRSYLPTLAAGAMLPLFFHDNYPADDSGEIFFRLIKRSMRVRQAGDIACPGGIIHWRIDTIFRSLINLGLPPLLRDKAGIYARERGPDSYSNITLFLATALRETWEEVRINPFHVRFLGPLPSYSLHLYRRVIFPFACLVKVPHASHCNSEVERIVDIPLRTFFHHDNYGTLIPRVDESLPLPEKESSHRPCLIFQDQEGRENILWGATFFIITSFLRIVLGFEIPEGNSKRFVEKIIDGPYLYGVS